MKNVVMFCENVQLSGEVPFLCDKFNSSYKDFSLLLSEKNIRLLIANFVDYSDSFVLKYWVFDGGWVLKNDPQRVEFVFDKFPGICSKSKFIKKEFLNRGIKVLNHPDLECMFKDKFLTYSEFVKESPLTIPLNDSFGDIIKKIRGLREKKLHDDLDSNVIFFKPRFGHGGKGIIVIEGNDFASLKSIEFKDYIMQPLIKIRSLPELGLFDKYDLRLVMDSERVRVCYARIPDKGFVSNVGDGSGGSNELFIDKSLLDDTIVSFGNFVNENFKKFKDRLISIDFVIGESGKPWLIELNGKPGLVYKTSNSVKRAVETQKVTVDVISSMVFG